MRKKKNGRISGKWPVRALWLLKGNSVLREKVLCQDTYNKCIRLIKGFFLFVFLFAKQILWLLFEANVEARHLWWIKNRLNKGFTKNIWSTTGVFTPIKWFRNEVFMNKQGIWPEHHVWARLCLWLKMRPFAQTWCLIKMITLTKCRIRGLEFGPDTNCKNHQSFVLEGCYGLKVGHYEKVKWDDYKTFVTW